MVLLFQIFVMVLALAFPAAAQEAGENNSAPIEVTADKTLEWRRADMQFVADGNAVVKQGDVTISGNSVTAEYRDTKESSMDIYRMTATGNVSIANAASTAKGDKLVYDVDTGLATLTGNNLVMTSDGQTVTATEKIVYDANAGKLTAYGNARAVRGQDTLQASTLSAVFHKGTDGRQALNRLEAHGAVRIITPAETLTGSDAVYTASTNTAIITGGVKIARGTDVLTGERGEINLTTNISRLYGSETPAASVNGAGDGRVRGVFYPGKNEKTN